MEREPSTTSEAARVSPRSLERRVLGVLAWNLVATAFVMLLTLGSGGGPGRSLLDKFVIAFVYSNCIGILVGMAFELTPFGRFVSEVRFPLNWALLVATLCALTLAGSFLAVSLLTAAGRFPPDLFWTVLRYSSLFSIAIALVIGGSAFAWDRVQERLERTAVELQRRQLAEERARKLAAEARLSSLESRVHPHFLFNTLNSIAALIREDPARAETTVERLASLLRFSLEAHRRGTVPLEQELLVVEKYLEIERVRFGERLRYRLEVGDELCAVEVPPLSLQTLVENSVKHAVSPSRRGAEILVRGSLRGGRAEIEVSDDGPGFDAGALVEGHGLDTLRERLGSLFGEAATLAVSTGGGRTAVTMTLPCARAPEGALR